MKKSKIFMTALALAMSLSLCACGEGITAQESTLKEDYTSVISGNSQFSDLSIMDFNEDDGTYEIVVAEDDEVIGMIQIGIADDGSIKAYIAAAIDASTKLLASAFMLGDNRLSYSEAYDIAVQMNENYNKDLYGEDTDVVVKNGIRYDCGEYEGVAMCAVRDISEEDTEE